MGLEFPHRVGIAAGLDKNAKALRFMRNMGFGFVEVGTVTPLPQPGNPKPRLFRLTRNQALINRMGFNNPGVIEMAKQLKQRPSGLIVGGNIGKNTLTPNDRAVEDYAVCFERLYPYVDYIAVNVSCPNIRELRDLQNRKDLETILLRLLEIRSQMKERKPVVLKLSPDLTDEQLDETIEVVRNCGIDGIIATNTTTRRDNLDYTPEEINWFGSGGLSGPPLRQLSTDMIRKLRNRLGTDFPIIGSGGILSSCDALEKIEAGADLVQLYTGFIYEGPGILTQLLKALKD